MAPEGAENPFLMESGQEEANNRESAAAAQGNPY